MFKIAKPAIYQNVMVFNITFNYNFRVVNIINELKGNNVLNYLD